MIDYAKKAKGMSSHELKFSLTDINETLQLMRDKGMEDKYIQKLYKEHDAYIFELQNRNYYQ